MNTPPDRTSIALRELGVITAIVDDIPALDDDHGVLQYGSFYTEEVNGEELVDWVTGGSRADRSTTCTARSARPAGHRRRR